MNSTILGIIVYQIFAYIITLFILQNENDCLNFEDYIIAFIPFIRLIWLIMNCL